MALHKIEKGLDLPISGKPLQVVRGTTPCTRVAVMADDFPGMKPRMHVEEGAQVKRGDVLFEDRKQPGVLHTAPGAGRVIAIHRGDKRALQSIVIDLSDAERRGEPGEEEFASFESYTGASPETLAADQIRGLLVESGLWTAIRERPFGKVPSPEKSAKAALHYRDGHESVGAAARGRTRRSARRFSIGHEARREARRWPDLSLCRRTFGTR